MIIVIVLQIHALLLIMSPIDILISPTDIFMNSTKPMIIVRAKNGPFRMINKWWFSLCSKTILKLYSFLLSSIIYLTTLIFNHTFLYDNMSVFTGPMKFLAFLMINYNARTPIV